MELDDDVLVAIGDSLEARGFTHSEIDDHFLAHYGVKGMRWGSRKAARKEAGIGGRHPEIRRSRGQKAAIAGAAYASYAIGGNIAMKILARKVKLDGSDERAVGKMAVGLLAASVASIGVGALGLKYSRRLVDKHNQTRVADIPTLPPEFDE